MFGHLKDWWQADHLIVAVDISFEHTVRVIQMRLGALPSQPKDYDRWYQSILDEIATMLRRPWRWRS